ncbi:anaerobic sulfatase maturase [Jeongeupia sp. HS-3]|uniref:anaerobic sulfatase maturase n=1 Tax=Jeongeupia sp. HS-3 TaxID=1009682 RepID=UPI0018A4E2C7|nr:anaerobic sulfatase maturase [Jeongeupia sp. HS-3]BCL75927.1 anaerobic sulfatase maturase [Jeongeupia sp. HS-3]
MLSFMAKPTSFKCNIRCDYCFYLQKEAFVEPPHGNGLNMADDVLETFVRKQVDAGGQDVYFTWQGGEPTLAGLDFYRRAVALQQACAGGKRIHNAFQTNGIALDNEWAAFFKEHDFLIGLSLDGDEELHDAYRVTATGRGTFGQVMRAVELLKHHGVEFNTLTVVNDRNVKHPLRVYRFLKQIGSTYLQFIPVVETGELDEQHRPVWFANKQVEPTPTDFSVDALEYGRFMTAIFDEWARHDIGTVFVQMFESLLARFCGFAPSMCIFQKSCGGANLAIEANGDVYSCDHFVYPEHLIGNIKTHTLTQIGAATAPLSARKDALNRQCSACPWVELCNGGCPKHRFVRNADGERHNYFCGAYEHIFSHLTPALNFMAELKSQGASPALLGQYFDRIYPAQSQTPGIP